MNDTPVYGGIKNFLYVEHTDEAGVKWSFTLPIEDLLNRLEPWIIERCGIEGVYPLRSLIKHQLIQPDYSEMEKQIANQAAYLRELQQQIEILRPLLTTMQVLQKIAPLVLEKERYDE